MDNPTKEDIYFIRHRLAVPDAIADSLDISIEEVEAEVKLIESVLSINKWPAPTKVLINALECSTLIPLTDGAVRYGEAPRSALRKVKATANRLSKKYNVEIPLD